MDLKIRCLRICTYTVPCQFSGVAQLVVADGDGGEGHILDGVEKGSDPDGEELRPL